MHRNSTQFLKEAPPNSSIFCEQQRLRGMLDQKTIWMHDQLAQLPEREVLQLDDHDYVNRLFDAQRVAPVSIVSGPSSLPTDQPTGFSTLLQRATVKIPVALEFSGDSILLTMLPSQYPCAPLPKGRVLGNCIHFEHVFDSLQKTCVMGREIAAWADAIRGLLAQQAKDIELWTIQVKRELLAAVRTRKQHFGKTQSIIDAVGIPLYKRPDPAGTFEVPLERKQLKLANSTASASRTQPAAVPDPTLKMDDYEEILTHLRHMCRTMERFPGAFEKLEEEEIRAFFLMHLNGHYRGAAVGEAFSSLGKTDIYLPYEHGQVFIAECKFWEGPKAFRGIYEQLQNYLTWRDTKTAILLFVDNEAIQPVLDKISTLVAGLPGFKKAIPVNHQGEFRALLTSESHADKQVVLTVQCFHIPKRKKED